MPVQVAERLVEDFYADITISEDDYRHLAAEVDAAFDKRSADRDQEFADLTANRARLEAESDKLLAAHFADAIDLPTLKRHQDRVRAGLADIEHRLREHDELHVGGRAFLHDSLRLLTAAHRAYAHSDDGSRRLANQAFYTRLEITEDEELRTGLAEPFATIVREATGGKEAKRDASTGSATGNSDVACSRKTLWVEAMERCGNRRPRVERLVSAWNQGIREDAEFEDGADDPLIGASAEPKKRPRTRLTDTEVETMRTARAQGVSVNALARRFGVHRGTVWAKTR
ncbi:hypothetical protein [Salana multivorans]